MIARLGEEADPAGFFSFFFIVSASHSTVPRVRPLKDEMSSCRRIQSRLS